MENTINKIVNNITELFLNPIIYLLISLSVMYFFWGLTLFILNADEEGKRVEGRNHMMWGIIGLFIIFSVWGIINIISGTIDTL